MYFLNQPNYIEVVWWKVFSYGIFLFFLVQVGISYYTWRKCFAKSMVLCRYIFHYFGRQFKVILFMLEFPIPISDDNISQFQYFIYMQFYRSYDAMNKYKSLKNLVENSISLEIHNVNYFLIICMKCSLFCAKTFITLHLSFYSRSIFLQMKFY